MISFEQRMRLRTFSSTSRYLQLSIFARWVWGNSIHSQRGCFIPENTDKDVVFILCKNSFDWNLKPERPMRPSAHVWPNVEVEYRPYREQCGRGGCQHYWAHTCMYHRYIICTRLTLPPLAQGNDLPVRAGSDTIKSDQCECRFIHLIPQVVTYWPHRQIFWCHPSWQFPLRCFDDIFLSMIWCPMLCCWMQCLVGKKSAEGEKQNKSVWAPRTPCPCVCSVECRLGLRVKCILQGSTQMRKPPIDWFRPRERRNATHITIWRLIGPGSAMEPRHRVSRWCGFQSSLAMRCCFYFFGGGVWFHDAGASGWSEPCFSFSLSPHRCAEIFIGVSVSNVNLTLQSTIYCSILFFEEDSSYSLKKTAICGYCCILSLLLQSQSPALGRHALLTLLTASPASCFCAEDDARSNK